MDDYSPSLPSSFCRDSLQALQSSSTTGSWLLKPLGRRENREAYCAAAYGVAKSQTQLSE